MEVRKKKKKKPTVYSKRSTDIETTVKIPVVTRIEYRVGLLDYNWTNTDVSDIKVYFSVNIHDS